MISKNSQSIIMPVSMSSCRPRRGRGSGASWRGRRRSGPRRCGCPARWSAFDSWGRTVGCGGGAESGVKDGLGPKMCYRCVIAVVGGLVFTMFSVSSSLRCAVDGSADIKSFVLGSPSSFQSFHSPIFVHRCTLAAWLGEFWLLPRSR